MHEALGTWDVVLIDCPPSLGQLTVNALVAAHTALLVTEPRASSVDGLAGIVRSIATVRAPSLTGPVDVALAKLEEEIPPEHRVSGGSVYELKWDGYRLVIVRTEAGVWLWSRNRKDLTARFPDIAATALERLPPGIVVDGEVVIWNNGRLDFDLLQRRPVSESIALKGLFTPFWSGSAQILECCA